MWKINQGYADKVKKVLDELGGICPRCLLRCSGVKNSAIMRDAEKPSTHDENAGKETFDEPPTKKSKILPCRLCLGLLEERYVESALESISLALKTESYDENHFTVAISLPVSLTLRQHSICLHLADKLEGFDEDEVIPIKQVWKWLFPMRLEKTLGKKYVTGNNCEFYIELVLDFKNDELELEAMQKICADEYSKRAKNQKKYHMGLVTRVGIEKSLQDVPASRFRQFYTVPPDQQELPLTWKVELKHDSAFVAGRYNKFSRELPQTPWILDGKRIFEHSVEELISSKLKDNMHIDDLKFSSSGREDVDVRMLGLGRPFLFELVNPRKVYVPLDEMLKIQESINSSSLDIFIRDLQMVSKASINALKEGEDAKRKTYRALCVINKEFSIDWVKEKLEAITDLELAQHTPIRVLHRRADAKRLRTVYYMKVESPPMTSLPEGQVNESNPELQMFYLTLATQAGTYVKEFVHGDFGRTEPNLAQILGCDVDIIALDVEQIDLDWPPKL